jgi:hypothetical protein
MTDLEQAMRDQEIRVRRTRPYLYVSFITGEFRYLPSGIYLPDDARDLEQWDAEISQT